MKTTLLLITLQLFTIQAFCQSRLEPLAGYSVDMNNDHRFKALRVGLQFSISTGRKREFLASVQKTIPVKVSSTDSAFTANPSLPLYMPAEKLIRAGSFSIMVGNRHILTPVDKPNKLALIYFAGWIFQNFKVSYKHDKANYIVLNPDRSLKEHGLFVKGGIEFLRTTEAGRFFGQVTVESPPARKDFRYPASFEFMAALSFNIGYSVDL